MKKIFYVLLTQADILNVKIAHKSSVLKKCFTFETPNRIKVMLMACNEGDRSTLIAPDLISSLTYTVFFRGKERIPFK